MKECRVKKVWVALIHYIYAISLSTYSVTMSQLERFSQPVDGGDWRVKASAYFKIFQAVSEPLWKFWSKFFVVSTTKQQWNWRLAGCSTLLPQLEKDFYSISTIHIQEIFENWPMNRHSPDCPFFDREKEKDDRIIGENRVLRVLLTGFPAPIGISRTASSIWSCRPHHHGGAWWLVLRVQWIFGPNPSADTVCKDLGDVFKFRRGKLRCA